MIKKIIVSVLVFVFILTVLNPVTVYADIGPKPSVVIEIAGLEYERYYVTLLSETPSTGPHSVLGEHPNNQRYHEEDEDYAIWQEFVSYEDDDGYYFLQYFSEGTETSLFTWGYFPPSKFKILLYFPEYDSFIISGEAYERYAFDSYYKIDIKNFGIQPNSTIEGFIAEKSYNHTWEQISLITRIIGTITIEILIALLFGFCSKNQLLLIGAINIATQVILNLLLNMSNYNNGSMMFVFNYIWMEALIFIIEAIIYSMYLHRISGNGFIKKWCAPLYAFTANTASFCIGLLIVYLLPEIF